MKKSTWSPSGTRAITLVSIATCLCTVAWANGPNRGWQASEMLMRSDNAQVPGGCPIESPTGRFIFTARNPSGNNIDIYVNERSSIDEPFEAGAILPQVISDPSANDFCPTPLKDGEFFFVSNRPNDDECGGVDMYRSVNNPATGYSDPQILGCYPDGPNTPGTEFSPSVVETKSGTYLFYSTDYPSGDQDIYVSTLRSDGSFGPGKRLGYPVNTEFDDKQPNVSPDGRELVFASDRPNADGEESFFDIFTATRGSALAPFSKVINLSETVPFSTEAADESRPSLSWDGQRLLYGSGGVWESKRR